MVQSQAGRSVSIASEFYPCTHCTQTGGLRLMRHDRQLILQQMYGQDKCNRECVINKCKCETHHRQRQGIYEVLHTGGAICENSQPRWGEFGRCGDVLCLHCLSTTALAEVSTPLVYHVTVAALACRLSPCQQRALVRFGRTTT